MQTNYYCATTYLPHTHTYCELHLSNQYFTHTNQIYPDNSRTSQFNNKFFIFSVNDGDYLMQILCQHFHGSTSLCIVQSASCPIHELTSLQIK